MKEKICLFMLVLLGQAAALQAQSNLQYPGRYMGREEVRSGYRL